MFLSSRRTEGNFDRYAYFFKDTKVFFDFIPPECINEARKVLCHYYLPTCGNSTVFEPPTSVCEDVCEYLWNLCPNEFQQMALQFSFEAESLAKLGLTMINCLNTGEFISPLQYCCSDLDIEIRELWINPLSLILNHNYTTL